MESEHAGWWREHAPTVAVLLTAFALAFLVRSLFALSIFQQWGWLYVYGGGSDSFYHSRVMAYIIQNHTNLIRDPGLHYPFGAINPREPLFDWMNAVLGTLFHGLFAPTTGQSSAVAAGSFFLDIQAPLWAAFGVFPVYLIGKEVSSRRMGLVAALIFPFMVSSIESSGLGYANYLTFYAFVMLVTVYSYLRTVRSVGQRRWVASYRHPREAVRGVREFLRVERTGVKWAVFTGVCLGALALSWQGYPFFIAAIVIFLIAQMVIERIRRVDSFGLYVATWIVGLVGFPMAMPYYYFQGLFVGWFDTPLLLFFGALLILLPFLLLREYPWVVSVPVLLATAGAAVGALAFIAPQTFVTIVTGQGYFIKTLVYSTVAEAQAPSIDSLILGFGVLTFFLAFAGLALFALRLARQKFRREQVMFFVFALLSIYLPITAAKFFLLGSAAFALLPAEVLLLILNVAGYEQLRRNVASLSDRRGQFTSFRRSFKARHVLVMGLVLLVVVPNIWYAIDAGVPYNVKSQYNLQIYGTLPPPLRPPATQANQYFLGAAGTSLDTPNQYDEDGYNWLATQDANVPLPQRPAFVSWWDYGFQALAEGQHPTVADNFQNGIDAAGQFLLSQNESQAIAVLAIDLLTAEQHASGQPYLPAGLNAVLARDGLDITELHTLLVNTSRDVPLVLAHPERYLPVDAGHLDPTNAMYLATEWYIADALPVSGVAQVYGDIESYTGWSVGYAMSDSRLFPVSGQSTGIYYAPADLTDRVIGPGGTPSDFFNVTVVGSDGNTYPAGEVPPGVQPVNYNINYFAPFYNSMIYRISEGYNGTDVGQGSGMPGISIQGTPEPAWMMSHFQVVYRTSYYCPYGNPNSCGGSYVAMNTPTAVALAHRHNGSADTSAGSYYQGGETILQYYPGEPLLGTATLPDGSPVAGARVTVYDGWGIPHMTTVTDANGAFRLVLPPGNDTVNLTAGSFDAVIQAGTTHLSTLHLVVPSDIALRPNAPPLVKTVVLRPASLSGFVYWNTANNTTFDPHLDQVISGATVEVYGGGTPLRTAVTDASGSYQFTNLPPGVFDYALRYAGANLTKSGQSPLYLAPGESHNQTIGVDTGHLKGHVLAAGGAAASGAEVRVYSARGLVANTTSSPTGSFDFGNLAPGNYSVRASLPSRDLASPSSSFTLAAVGASTTLNLTLAAVVSVSLTVLSGGNPVGGFPVRFTPILSAAAPRGTNATSAENSTSFLTPTNGTLTVTLPVGNYSVYAAGLIGTGLYAGFESAYLASGLPFTVLAPLNLSPAFVAAGESPPPSGGGSPTEVEISVFSPRGDVLTARANISGDWMVVLPAGSYSVSALLLPSGGRGAAYAALGELTVPSTSPLALTLTPAQTFRTLVGAPLAGGGIYPAPGALVTVSLEPTGAQMSTVSDAGGNATLVVPGKLPAGESYCVNASAYGFLPYGRCALSSDTLATLTALPLALRPVPTNLTFSGFPAGTVVRVNLTAEGPPAESQQLIGGPAFYTQLLPGSYSLTAWASPAGGGALYRPGAAIPVTLPFGYHEERLSILLLHQLSVQGRLSLPSGVSASGATIRFVSAGVDTNVSGSAFTSGFLLPAASYVVEAQVSGPGGTYANLSRVTVNATGILSPGTLALTSRGGVLHANLTTPALTPLNATAPVSLTTGAGITLTATSLAGAFSILLPLGTTVTPALNLTLPSPGPGGVTVDTRYTVLPGQSCLLSANVSDCHIRLGATVLPAPIAGALILPGHPGPLSGSVLFVPAGQTGPATTVPVSGSTFAATLTPGVYDYYAVAGSPGAELAALGQVSFSYAPLVFLNLSVAPAWTDTLTVLAQASPAAATATLRWSGSSGAIRLAGEPVGVPLTFALPVGLWQLTANSTSRPYGPTVSSAGSATVALLAGNAATLLTLVPQYTRSVAFTLQGPTRFTAPAGATVSFSYSLRNTGDLPVSFRLVGNPSSWHFNFSSANVTLAVTGANASATGEVTVVIPRGTDVVHPPIVLEALGANGSFLGVATPAPTVQVLAFYGVAVGLPAALGTEAPHSATVPFWVSNTGNSIESVRLGLSDLSRLVNLGWSASIEQGTTPVRAAVSLDAGSNTTYQVLLTSQANNPLLPESVTVSATVLNGSGAVTAEAVLPVPTLPVTVSNDTLGVTGPSLGSPPPYPDWLVPVLSFLPALALLLGLVSYRWYRTRRWVRR